ncbi:MAG: RDD family protein [Desulfobaccales bacterium]
MFCPACGKEAPELTNFCQYCGQTLNRADGEAQMPRPAAGPPACLEYAGFWLRFVALLIDGVFLSIVILGAITVLEFILGAPAARSIRLLICIIVSWLYFALMESSPRQATLGKMALGLKVTDLQGEPISFGKATGRFFGKFVSGLILCIGFMMAGWTRKRQALHDLMAGTLVVKRRSLPEKPAKAHDFQQDMEAPPPVSE